jgi:N-acetylmuramoyl-L-alanine amidase
MRKIQFILALCLVMGCQQSNNKGSTTHYKDTSKPSATYDNRVQYLIIHYTAVDEEESFYLLNSAHWPASSHYLITDPPPRKNNLPVVYQLVDESDRAWHTGASQWGSHRNLNASSIGIEIVNFGYLEEDDPDRFNYHDWIALGKPYILAEERLWPHYGEEQMDALVALTKDIVERYGIVPEYVLAHSDIAPTRKSDPGPLLPWERLYNEGVGAWYEEDTLRRFVDNRPLDLEVDNALLLATLKAYGFPVPPVLDKRIPTELLNEGEVEAYNEEVRLVIRAFQLHFRQSNFSGIADVESEAIALALLERYQGEEIVETVRNSL